MSAGLFELSTYESNEGDLYPIRIQPETLQLNINGANAAPTGEPDQAVSARARKSRRAYGVGARTVRVRFTAAAPTGYAEGQVLTVPVLTAALWDPIKKRADRHLSGDCHQGCGQNCRRHPVGR